YPCPSASYSCPAPVGGGDEDLLRNLEPELEAALDNDVVAMDVDEDMENGNDHGDAGGEAREPNEVESMNEELNEDKCNICLQSMDMGSEVEVADR
ncbi:unnamed protein product, partial [Durusdinium trenchii]